MGFFDKIWKGLKSGVKKIGKGIKSAFKKFGKFMNKIGILGQIAMFFIMPYVGQALSSMWTGIAGQTVAQGTAQAAANVTAQAAGQQVGATVAQQAAGKVATKALAEGVKKGVLEAVVKEGVTSYVATQATGLMARNALAQGVGHVMQFTANTVGKVGNVFSNITQGVTDTLGNFAKTASNNIFGTSFDAAANFFGPGDSAFSRSFGKQSRFQNLTSSESVFEQFKEDRLAEEKMSKTLADLNSPEVREALNTAATERVPDSLMMPQGPDLTKGLKGLDITGRAPLVESTYQPLTAEQINSVGTEISDDMLNDYKFNIEGVAGDKKFTFGDRVRFMSEKNLAELGQIDDIDFLKNFQTPEALAPNIITDAATQRATAESGIAEIYDVLNETRAGGPAPVIEKSFYAQPPSLMERLKTGVKGIPDAAYKKLGEIADDPFGYAGKGMEKRFQSGVQTRLMQEAGILEKPTYTQNYVTNNAYVPSFESFGGSQQQYGAPEIMSPRAFEQQVTNSPNPYGYTAFQYGNYMAQFAQTA